ncbi:MAG: LysM peptidoglycan-binding domain-containing protein [Candidatus Riflebacteria bacterium]|nr:LysM peptidoglycan-binding domain-containing protein [Candidatus Riflebacteria bacterium]
MFRKLKPRHYSILVLCAIVAVETTAITVDRVFAKSETTAYELKAPYKNNALIETFRNAESRIPSAPLSLRAKESVPAKTSFEAEYAKAVEAVKENRQLVSRNIPEKNTSENQRIAKVDPVKIPAPQIVYSPPEHWVNFKVAKGDNLNSIASRFNITPKDIFEANGIIDHKSLKVGQTIKIPAKTGKKVFYYVKSGDSLSKIASRFGLSLSEIVTRNKLAGHSLSENQKIEIPVKANVKTVEVTSSENSASISRLEMLEKASRNSVNRNLEIIRVAPMTGSLQTVRKPSITIVKNSNPALPRLSIEKKVAPAVKPVLLPAPIKSYSVSQAKISTNRKIDPATNTTATNTPEKKILTYTVQSGDTLSKLAKNHESSVNEIMSQNRLCSTGLMPGQKISIPVSKKFFRVTQVTTRRNPADAKVFLPVRGRMTDGYGWRRHPVWGRRMFHAGIDLAAARGTPLFSTMAGTVVYAGWRAGYGKLIIVKHANGYSTRYGHCSNIRVAAGQMVRAGHVIGNVGATGTATGNHLHFEVRRFGQTLNPAVALGLRSPISKVSSGSRKHLSKHVKRSKTGKSRNRR